MSGPTNSGSPMGGMSPMNNSTMQGAWGPSGRPQPGTQPQGGWGGSGAYNPGIPSAGGPMSRPTMPTGAPQEPLQQPNTPLTPASPQGNMPTSNPVSPTTTLTPAFSQSGTGGYGGGQGPQYSGLGAGQMNFPQMNFGGLGNMLGGLNLGGMGGK